MFVIVNLILLISLTGVFLNFVVYPGILWVTALILGEKSVKTGDIQPFVSLILVGHNMADLIDEKISNALSLNYPNERFEIILYSDGSTDQTREKAEKFTDQRVHCFFSEPQKGKNLVINQAVHKCQGDIILFTDMDALLDADALNKMICYFADSTIGGVCGQRIIAENHKNLSKAQTHYINFDSRIKLMESRIGSITSNDGKIYAIRKSLFKPVEPSVTDDLYIALNVVRQGFRFVFEPDAKSYIHIPSRNPKHEIRRRRRIVCQSLTGIFLNKMMLNPFQYGTYAIRLFINKVNRRFLPIWLILLYFSSLYLMNTSFLVAGLLILQSGFYLSALLYSLRQKKKGLLKLEQRIGSLTFYFCVGNVGTLLGVIDYISGKRISQWQPVKSD